MQFSVVDVKCSTGRVLLVHVIGIWVYRTCNLFIKAWVNEVCKKILRTKSKMV